jgi:hypothetical protein
MTHGRKGRTQHGVILEAGQILRTVDVVQAREAGPRSSKLS